MFEQGRSYCIFSLNTSYIEEYLKKIIDFSDLESVYVIKPVDNIGIDEIRNAIDFLSVSKEKTKYLVIYDSEKMTVEAVNAFLKTLEEPSKGSVIILTTTKWKNLLKTVKSRVEKRVVRLDYLEKLGRINSFNTYLALKAYSFYLNISNGNFVKVDAEDFFETIEELDKYSVSLNFYELLNQYLKIPYSQYLEFVRRFKEIKMNLDILKSVVLSAMWCGFEIAQNDTKKISKSNEFLRLCDDILKSKVANYNYFMTVSAVLINLRKLSTEEGNR